MIGHLGMLQIHADLRAFPFSSTKTAPLHLRAKSHVVSVKTNTDVNETLQNEV